MDITFNKSPHRRLNILTGEWVQVSPHCMKRPWQGQYEEQEKIIRRNMMKMLSLPGSVRAGGAQNPVYSTTFAFENDFSALLPDTELGHINKDNLLVANSENGICRVIYFSPRQNLTLPEMEVNHIRKVVDLWVDEYRELGSKPFINYV